jgi:hypothetical protein
MPTLFQEDLHQLIKAYSTKTVARSVKEDLPTPIAISEMEKIMHNKLLNYYWCLQVEDLEAAIQPTLLPCLSVSTLPLVGPIAGSPSLLDHISSLINNTPLAEPTPAAEPPLVPSLVCAQSKPPENPWQ